MTHAATPISHLSEASRHIYDAEARIARQQELAEVLQRQGHARAARQAREILAMFVKSYFVMHHYWQTLETELGQPTLAALDPEICLPSQGHSLGSLTTQQ